MNQVVRTRIAPSPTGKLHIGSLATALKNYAFAKNQHGQFIIRVEDTDQNRLVPEALDNILITLKNYGLSWDEGPDIGGPYAPYTQSQRLSLYQHYAQELIRHHKAYYCFCSKDRLEQMRQNQQQLKQLPKYDRFCLSLSQSEINQKLSTHTPHVVRLKIPLNQQVVFTDLIRGQISFETNIIDDQVLLKSDGFPTYHLGVVVDDYLMKISHVIRGEEWISSTPKHILLYQAFGWPIPIYAHVPDLLSPTGKGKMSKRHGDVSAENFLTLGYLPKAMLNFLMVLGWSTSNQEEILSLDRYIKEFNPKDLNKKSVAFDTNKLNYLNGYYIRQLTNSALYRLILPFKPQQLSNELLKKIIPHIKERLVLLSDITKLSYYFYQEPTIILSDIAQKSKFDLTQITPYFNRIISILNSITNWKAHQLESNLRQFQEKYGLKPRPAFMSIRLAITGESATPPLFDIMEILGKNNCLSRLNRLIS